MDLPLRVLLRLGVPWILRATPGYDVKAAPDVDRPLTSITVVSMRVLQWIRRKVRDREYFLSQHAEDEMFDDDLERADVEHAILHGRIDKKLTRDPRGTRYRIVGPASDKRLIAVICRFREDADLIIITVYAKDS